MRAEIHRHESGKREGKSMMEEALGSIMERCPNCLTDLSPHGAKGEPPPFCLQCRFPTMVIAGKYRLVKLLQEGGYGLVYQARHIHLHEDFHRVIKVIKPEQVSSKEQQLRFVREVQVTSVLSQKNNHIVRIYDDFGHIPNLGHYYVMEFLNGFSLLALMEKAGKLLPFNLCAHLFFQLCEAIRAAHREGVVHRDLKPENIFVTPQMNEPYFLKVIDFGIAKSARTQDNLTGLTQGALGTPTYMSPEQCTNQQIDARTDIYAIGVILYELLTGRPPFLPELEKGYTLSMLDILKSHIQTPPPPLKDVVPPGRNIPLSLEPVLFKALEKSPIHRFASVNEFEMAFRAAIGEEALLKGDLNSLASFSDLPLLKELSTYQKPSSLGKRENDMESRASSQTGAFSRTSAFSRTDDAFDSSMPLSEQKYRVQTPGFANVSPQRKNAIPKGVEFLSMGGIRVRQSVAGVIMAVLLFLGGGWLALQIWGPLQGPPAKRKKTLQYIKKSPSLLRQARKGRLVPGCPQDASYDWVYVSIPPIQIENVQVLLLQAKGRKKRAGYGFCVGFVGRRALLHLMGMKKAYIPCTFSLWRRPSTVEVELEETGGMETMSRDYCFKR